MKIVLSRSLFTMLVVFAAGSATAQTDGSLTGLYPAFSAYTNVADNDKMQPVTTEVAEKAIRHFNCQFTHSSDVKWYKMNGLYMSKFINDGVKTRADYSSSGRWLLTIQYFGEDKLPAAEKQLFKNAYEDDKIDGVEAIRIPYHPNTIYIVHAKLNNITRLVRIAEGELQELEVLKNKLN